MDLTPMGKQSNSANLVKVMSLSQVLQTLREEDNIDVLLQTSLSYLQAKFNYRLIWIGLYDRLDHQLVGKGVGSPDEESSFLKQRFSLNAGDLLEQAIIQLEPIAIADLQAETRAGDWGKLAQTYQIRSALLYPLRHKDRGFGVVLIGGSEWGRTPDANEREHLAIVLGGLATALYHIESEWQRQQTKHPSASLLKLLSEFRNFARLDHYLEAVVKETHRCIQPTRTHIYWYNQEGRYFWRRTSNLKKTPEAVITRAASGIHIQDLSEFYRALAADRLVSIGQSHSTLKAEVARRLIRRMRVRSLLAAPILFNQELRGFLAVEVKQPRIWQTHEKTFLRGMAQLLGTVVPLAEMNQTIGQIEQNQALTAEIARAIVGDEDWQMLLSNTAERLGQRLKTEYFFVFEERPGGGQFNLFYQNPLPHYRLLTDPLGTLPPGGERQLQKTGAIALEQWGDDPATDAWGEPLREIGVRSLLVCPMAEHRCAGNPGSGRRSLLVVAHSSARTWTQTDIALVKIVGQQLGLILHQWHLNHQVQIHHHLAQMSAKGWQIVRETDDIGELERRFAEEIAADLSSRLLLLVTWGEKENRGEIVRRYEQQKAIEPAAKLTVDLDADPLVQRVLAAEGIICQNVGELPLSTRQWLNCPPDCRQIWAIALRTHPDHECTGALIVAHPHLEEESRQTVELLRGFVTQLAWMRRYLKVQARLCQERQELQWLNWYKQRRLEELYRIIGSRVKELNELKQFPPSAAGEHKHQLTHLRYQQLLRQISQTLASTSSLLKQEQWHLYNRQDLIVVSNLLRRVSDRIHPVLKNRQLLLQVQQQKNLTLIADSLKLELVLYELLLIACYRSPSIAAIEIKVQALDESRLELVIIDGGIINPQLVRDLQLGRSSDVLAPSSLDRPPGQHLMIVARIIQQMGGQFQLQQLDEGQIVSRLILPSNAP